MSEAAGPRSILWGLLDGSGHESARIALQDDHWILSGTAVFAHEGRPCRLDYRVRCDTAWNTVAARVDGWVGDATIDIEITVEPGQRWRLNGVECPAVAGCTDVDLNFSPSTNLLPIRRLGLAIGAAAPVRAAWLRFPSFVLEPLEQVYRRSAVTAYRYESAGGAFGADLEVDDAGLVTLYPTFCRAEART